MAKVKHLKGYMVALVAHLYCSVGNRLPGYRFDGRVGQWAAHEQGAVICDLCSRFFRSCTCQGQLLPGWVASVFPVFKASRNA